MLAVVYATFWQIEKEKFRNLLLHKRKACQRAFRLLVSKKNPDTISFRHFEGLMKYYKPKMSKRQICFLQIV
jgi:two pore calcium channel protein 1